MKRFQTHKLSLLSALVLLAFLSAACSDLDKETRLESQATLLDVTLEVQGMSLGTLVNLDSTGKLDVQELTHTYTLGGENVVGFYPTPSSSILQGVSSSWPEQYSALAEDLNISQAATPVFKVVSVEGVTSELNLEVLKARSDVISVTVHQKSAVFEPAQSEPEGELQTAGLKGWVPTSGEVVTAPSRYGYSNRFVTNYFTWSRNAFGTGHGYEHDFHLNNDSNSALGSGTYFSRNTYGAWRKPIVEYAATTLPSTAGLYLDVRLFDPSTEIAYTIGMLRANRIQVGKRYWSYIRVRSGDTSRDNGKLTAALMGRNVPQDRHIPCGSQYCAYQLDYQRLIPAWNVPVPGRKSWRY